MNPRIWQLVARKVSQEATLDELRELEYLFQSDPELRYRVELYTRYFEQPLASARTEEDKNLSLRKFQKIFLQEFSIPKIPKKDSPVRKYTLLKYASMAAAILLAFSVYWFYNNDDRTDHTAQLLPMDEMNTMPGTRSRTVLPDGTTVWLNSASRIYYNSDFGKSKREITLTGEAFFDVAHNEKVPMVLHAGDVNILVKGTAFNVRNYPDGNSVEASLIRGSIELTTNNDPGRKILLKPNEKITIGTKTEQHKEIKGVRALQKTDGNIYQIAALHESALSHTIPEVSWIEDKLVFDNESFAEVISKMEKWYNLEIILEDKALAAKQFSGAFEKEGIEEALSALQIVNHFDFEIKGKKVIIK